MCDWLQWPEIFPATGVDLRLENVANRSEAISAREKLELARSLAFQSLAALGTDAPGKESKA